MNRKAYAIDPKLTVIIATRFELAYRERAQILADLLAQSGFNCVFGEGFGGSKLSEGVRRSLAEADLVIALLEPEDETNREPSQWVLQEVIYAIALGKRCLLLVAKGVRFSQGLLGDVELINFDISNYAAVLPQVLRQLNVILRSQGLVIGVKEAATPYYYLAEEPGKEDGNEMARSQIRTAGRLTKVEDYGQALIHAEKAMRLDPTCWQAWIRYGGLLLIVRRLAEASKIHKQMLKEFKNDKVACAAAKHNLAVANELRFGIDSLPANMKAKPLFEAALTLDPLRIYTRTALVCTYLRLDKSQEALQLFERSLRYKGFIPAMRRELDEAIDGLKLLALLPTWAQNLLYPIELRTDIG